MVRTGLISEGHVCRSEIETLQQLQIERELGLAPSSFAQVIRALCEDLLLGAYGSGSMMCSVGSSGKSITVRVASTRPSASSAASVTTESTGISLSRSLSVQRPSTRISAWPSHGDKPSPRVSISAWPLSGLR